METEQLLNFIDTAKAGSFQKVADKNFISQRTVSKQMERLEIELGVKLFYRSHNKIVLTDAGYTFVNMAQEIVNKLNLNIIELKKIASANNNRLRIGYPTAFDLNSIIKNILTYTSHNMPKLGITFSEESVGHLLSDLSQGYLDCAYITNYNIHNKFEKELEDCILEKNSINFAINKLNPLSNLKHLDISDLCNQKIIYWALDDSLKEQSYIQRIMDTNKSYNSFVRVQTLEQLQLSIALNEGIALYPNTVYKLLAFEDHIKTIPLFKNKVQQYYATHLVYRKENNQNGLKYYLKGINLHSHKNN